MKVENAHVQEGERRELGATPGMTTWGLRTALGGGLWWKEVPGVWHRHVDGLWRKTGAGAQTSPTEKRRSYRPLVVRYTETKWNLDSFLAQRRRAGRDDEGVAASDKGPENKAAEVIVITWGPSEDDATCRRMLYRARQRATHAVVAVVADEGGGNRTEDYLRLCAGRGRQVTRTSGSEDRLAEAFETLGVNVQRQTPIGRYRLDFLIRGAKGDTDVEVDGRYWHTDENGERRPEDRWRDEVLAAVGIRTVRIWAEDVDRNPIQSAEHALWQHEL